MDRSKKVIFVSHCILNQNTVVCPLARAKGPYREIVEKIMEYDIGIHQMPCPEFRKLGLKRMPMNKAEYDTPEYRNLCNSLAKDTITILKEYISNDYKVIGLLGINGSPTCSINGIKGIFMEELLSLLEKEKTYLNKIDVPEDYMDMKDNKEFISKLESFLSSLSSK